VLGAVLILAGLGLAVYFQQFGNSPAESGPVAEGKTRPEPGRSGVPPTKPADEKPAQVETGSGPPKGKKPAATTIEGKETGENELFPPLPRAEPKLKTEPNAGPPESHPQKPATPPVKSEPKKGPTKSAEPKKSPEPSKGPPPVTVKESPPPPKKIDWQQQIKKAIDRGVAFLRSQQSAAGTWVRGPNDTPGATALCGWALLEAGVPAADPTVRKAAVAVRQFALKETKVYHLALDVFFLDRLGDSQDVPFVESLTMRLLAAQNKAGGWSYQAPEVSDKEQQHLRAVLDKRREPGRPSRPRDPNQVSPEVRRQVLQILVRPGGPVGPGDNSNTQFAMLALWVARRHGLPVEPALIAVGERFHKTRLPNGSWGYLPGAASGPEGHSPSMTCAGVLGLVLARCSDEAHGKGWDLEADPEIQAGLAYLDRILSDKDAIDTRFYYFLGSLERMAVACGRKEIGGVDWYTWGARRLVEDQADDGSWPGGRYPAGGVDTAFALLFLRKANVAGDLTEQLTRLRAKAAEPVVKSGPPANPKSEGLGESKRFTGHTDAVLSVAFSPDGRTFLSGSKDGTARLWDLETGAEIRRFARSNGPVTHVAFGDGGKVVITCHEGSGAEPKRWTVQEWDTRTGRPTRAVQQPDANPPSFSRFSVVSLEGNVVLTVIVHQPTARGFLTNVQPLPWRGKNDGLRPFAQPNISAGSAVLSGDGSIALTGPVAGRREPLCLWDLKAGTVRASAQLAFGVQALALARDAGRALSGGADKVVRLWETAGGRELRRFKGHTEAVLGVALSPDGSRVLSGGADQTVRLWNAQTGKELARDTESQAAVTCVSFSPDGLYALAGSADGTLRLWQLKRAGDNRPAPDQE
jgi:WD40 repeat protein